MEAAVRAESEPATAEAAPQAAFREAGRIDLRIVGPEQILERWPATAFLAPLGKLADRWNHRPSVTNEDYLPIAFVDPDGDPETIFVRRLDPVAAHRTLAHESLHVILLRLGEREASFMLDWIWARRRIG